MNRHLLRFAARTVSIFSVLALNACAVSEGGGVYNPIRGGRITDGNLAEKYANFFPIGAALREQTLNADRTLIEHNFNHMTAENAMKGDNIHPAEATWNTAEADALADFSRAKGWKMTGHTLVWHRQQPAWMFEGLTDGDAASIETLKSRLKSHIQGMVDRYGDVVDNWDVVNEVISDDPAQTYRTTNNKWYSVFGSTDYIYWAFRYTKEALEAQAPGSSVGKLYYNDYNETQKIDRILTMCKWLETHPEGGIHIDGIGLQGHWRIDWPSAADIGSTIDKAAAAGYKTKISEMDVTVYNDYTGPGNQFVAAPEIAFSTGLDTNIALRYKELFALLREKAANVTSVTLWGVRDEDSWLLNEPQKGRRNYPLLWNMDGAKLAYTTVLDF